MIRPAALARALAVGAFATAVACAAKAPATGVPAPGADEILRRAEAIRNPDIARACEVEIFSVQADAGHRGRQASYSLAAKGAADALALRQSDDELRGAALLLSADHMWILRPGRGAKDPYEYDGVQSRLGDWVALQIASLDLRHGWQVRLLGEERFGDELCYKLELTKHSETATWSRVLYWIGKADLRPRRLEGYAPDGLLVTMARYEGFTEGKLGAFPRRIVIEGTSAQDEIHTATFSDVRPLACDPASFSVEGLLALKDAARAKGVMTKSAAHVRIEDVLPAPPR